MFTIRRSVVFFLILTIVGSFFAYRIVARAYDGIIEDNVFAISQK